MTGFQLLPPLTESEYDALREDIRAHGILAPIHVDENGVILDGHHRQQIATELGINCPKQVVRGFHNDTSKRTHALTVNTNRRHLTIEQRRHLTETSLREDPHLTDREHARRIGVSPSSVGAARERLLASGQLERLEVRTDPRGRQHQAPPPPPPKPDPASATSARSTSTVQLDTSNFEVPTGAQAASATPAMATPHPATPQSSPPSFSDVGPVEPDTLASVAPIRVKAEPSDDPEVIDEEQARRSSNSVASSLAALWMVLDPSPVTWISTRYRPDAYRFRDLPHVRDALTSTGLRSMAKHLNDVADHLDKTGATL